MPYLISFQSKQFDLDKEEENPINPIKGKSIGDWMTKLLKTDGIEATEVDAEDWGWYSYVTYQGNKYLIGFIGLPADSEDQAPELMIQVDKSQSLFESILGKNKLIESDPLLSTIRRYINSIQDVSDIVVNKNA